jgi:hypothetical protein
MSGKTAKALRRAAKELADALTQGQPHPIVRYLRGVGVVGILAGGAGIVLGAYFWWAVGFVYLGLTVLLVDSLLEKCGPIIKGALIVGVVFLSATFTVGFVWLDARLDISSTSALANYPEGTDVYGIKWKPHYSELKVGFYNPTSRDYDDLDVLIRPVGVMTIAIAQVGTFPPCSWGRTVLTSATTRSTETDGDRRMELSGSTVPFRVRCPKLPKDATLQVVIATRGIPKQMPVPAKGQPAEDFVRNLLYGKKTRTPEVKVDAAYKILYHPYTVSVTVKPQQI